MTTSSNRTLPSCKVKNTTIKTNLRIIITTNFHVPKLPRIRSNNILIHWKSNLNNSTNHNIPTLHKLRRFNNKSKSYKSNFAFKKSFQIARRPSLSKELITWNIFSSIIAHIYLKLVNTWHLIDCSMKKCIWPLIDCVYFSKISIWRRLKIKREKPEKSFKNKKLSSFSRRCPRIVGILTFSNSSLSLKS